MIDTILFDLDGTLMNTLDDLTDSVNYALRLMNLPTHTVEEVMWTVGHGQHENLMYCLPVHMRDEETLNTMEKHYVSYYSVHELDKTKPYPGILELVSELKKRHIKLAVVSNKGDSNVKSICQKVFKDVFTTCIGLSDDVLPKPAPDMLFKALDVLHSTVATTLFVGDCEQDIETGKNTGCLSCGCSWGYRGRKILEQQGADFIIDHPMELLNIIDKAV